MAYHLRGFIVADDNKEFYEWCGWPATSPKDIKSWLESEECDSLITINSYGGDVFAAAEIFHDIAGKIDVDIVGLAASAAGFIAMAGKTLRMSAMGEIMIHNPWSYASGDYRDMKSAMQRLEAANESARNAYKYRTNLSDEDIQQMMDNETWLSAREAKELGFIDEILNESKEKTVNLRNTFGSVAGLYNSLNCEIIQMKNQKPAAEALKPPVFDSSYSLAEKAEKINDIAPKGAFLMQKRVLEIEKLRFGGDF